MIKNITLLILSFLSLQVAKAQKTTDTILCYMKNSGQLVTTRKAADYFMLIMPMDTSTKLSAINEYYSNGNPKLMGASSSRKYYELLFDGPCITYYPNGHKKSIISYDKGGPYGDVSFYYPNGNLYAAEKIGKNNRDTLIECRDSTGKVLAANGNGKWVKLSYVEDIHAANGEVHWASEQVRLKFEYTYHENEEGPIKDSLEEGEWHEMNAGHENYILIYHKGVVISTTDPDRVVGDPVFVSVEHEPEFINGGTSGFNKFLNDNVVFSSEDRQNYLTGRIIVSFIVEKDGSLSHLKTLRSPSKSMSEAVEKQMTLSPPWRPGFQNGQPARVQYTISFPFDFSK